MKRRGSLLLGGLGLICLALGMLAISPRIGAHAQSASARSHVDNSVKSFHFFSATQVVVQGNDDNLWLESAPFGQVPPSRVQIDTEVSTFQGLPGLNDVVVQGHNGNLWLEHAPFGHVPPVRELIDTAVSAFQPLSNSKVLVKGDDDNLWREQDPFVHVPPLRDLIDDSVSSFNHLLDIPMLLMG